MWMASGAWRNTYSLRDAPSFVEVNHTGGCLKVEFEYASWSKHVIIKLSPARQTDRTRQCPPFQVDKTSTPALLLAHLPSPS